MAPETYDEPPRRPRACWRRVACAAAPVCTLVLLAVAVCATALWLRDGGGEPGAHAAAARRPAGWPTLSVFNASCAHERRLGECPGYEVCLAEVRNFNESTFLGGMRLAREGPPRVSEARPWCTKWGCIDQARCVQPFKLYQYTAEDVRGTQLEECLEPFNITGPGITEHITDDPRRACAFWFEVSGRCRALRHMWKLKHWGGNGLNHVLVIHTDEGISASERVSYLGRAAIAQGHATAERFVPGLDIALGLHSKFHGPNALVLAAARPWARQHLLTFKGTWTHTARVRAGLHHDERRRVLLVTYPNPHQCAVSTSLRRPYLNSARSRRLAPLHADCCEKLHSVYKSYNYARLMNTTFALVLPGRQPASYRLAEVIATGAIPVFYGFEDAMLPYAELIDWRSMSMYAPIDVNFEGKLLPALEALAADRKRLLAMQRALAKASRHFDGDGSRGGNQAIVETLRRRYSFEL